MDAPRLRMQTEGKPSFTSQDSYDGVNTADLQELLRLGRETVLSLEDELARRNTSASNMLPSPVKACLEKLQSTMHTLRVVQRLEDPSGLASAAAEILKNEHKNRKEKVYKQFLSDVQQQCGGGVVVLCSSSLGKRRIVELKNSDRMFLLGYLKHNSNSFKHTILDNLAISHGIMTAPNEPVLGSDNTSMYPISVERQIEYKYSEACIEIIGLLGPGLLSAVQASRQWIWERQTGGSTTDCITGLSPKNRGDITLHFLVGFEEGTEFMEKLQMQAV